MRRTAETFSLSITQNSGYSQKRQTLVALPQGEEGKGIPEPIQGISRKRE